MAAAGAVPADTLHHTRHIPHVEISAHHTGEGEAVLAPLSTTLLSARTLEAAHCPSLLPTLQAHVPSLFITGRGVLGYGLSTGAAGTLKMRGVGGDKSAGVLVLLDGEPMVQGLMGHTLADTYQSLAAQQVEVVRGPASVRYGSDALGGAINIRTHGEERTGVEAHASYGPYQTLNSGAHLRYSGHNGFSATIAGQYDRTEGHRDGLDFEQGGAFVKLSQALNPHWRLTLQGYGTRFDSGNPGTTDTPLYDSRAQATRGTASLSLRHEYAEVEGSVRAYYSYGDHHIDDGHTADEAPLDYQFRSRDFIAGVNIDETLRPGRNTTLFFGFAAKKHGGKAWNEPLSTHPHSATHTTEHNERSYLIDTTLWSAGLYLCLSQELGRYWTLDGGIRYERDAASGNEWVPQGGLSWRPNRQTTFKALVSRGFRAPSLRELYLWASANPELKAERLTNYEASVERWWCRHRLRTQVTLYDLHAKNLIETTYVDGRARNQNLGRQRNYGAEVELGWTPARHWHYATHYSYLHTRQAVTAAPHHRWHQELAYTSDRWRIAPATEYVRGLHTSTAPLVTERYFLLNLNVEFRPAPWIQIFARGENLTGERYETILGYPMPRATAMGGVRIHLSTTKK
jgi:outer membrane cobalamin receptor